jgi:hypothetical protein
MLINSRQAACFVLACSIVLPPALVSAQSETTGAIAGVARDATGAVLPGVTVEAASPALIEKVRTAITDGQGQYKIVDLRPGTYSVTFALGGFSTVKREGVGLTTGFTANVNADMRVGALEETIVVSGASPVVDTQNVRSQNVLSREELEAIPAAHTTQGWAALTLGVTLPAAQQDVGGNRGESITASGIHGNRSGDSARQLDGMGINTMLGNGAGGNYYYKISDLMAQEVTLTTNGMSAEQETGGIVTNVVPRDGGNRFSLYSNNAYADRNLQSSNYSDGLKARGLPTPPSVKRIYDTGIGVGGPIVRDKLWFYTGTRFWGAQQELAGLYYNLTPHTLFYTPDLSRPAFLNNWAQDNSVRLSWQVNAKNKINYFLSYQKSCTCDVTGTAAAAGYTPAASTPFHYDPTVLNQVTWNYSPTNRLLLEAAGMYLYQTINSMRTNEALPSDIGVLELTTGLAYGEAIASLTGLQAYGGPNQSSSGKTRASMSYVTGSHAVKVGMTTASGIYNLYGAYDTPWSYTFRNQLPVSLTEYASPHFSESRLKLNLGLYAQDQWTIRRLTLNLGVRFSYFNAYNPAQVRPGGFFTAPLRIAEQDNTPSWKDLDPRLGAAYDVLGNGKTAVKVSVGRYVAAMATGLAQSVNPANAMVTQATRTWNDANHNFVPDCDLKNPLANGECGTLNNLAFGTVVVNTQYANNVLNGFGVRPYTWQSSVSVQQELRPNLAVTVGYFRTTYGNFQVTDNLATTAADLDPYCITAPADARLPNGGGHQICGLADVSPAKFGQVHQLVRQASDVGGISQMFNGFDIGMNARFGKGGLFSGGLSTGKTVYDNCNALMNVAPPASPVGAPSAWLGNTNYCRQTLAWAAQTQLKFQGVYPLPFWDIQASATFQSLAGIPEGGNYVATNAQIAPSLGRNLSACGAAATCTATVTTNNLFAPNSILEGRLNQADARLSKNFRVARGRIRANFDLYNIFNASTITQVNTTYGATWLAPRGILPGRLFKLGAQVNF